MYDKNDDYMEGFWSTNVGETVHVVIVANTPSGKKLTVVSEKSIMRQLIVYRGTRAECFNFVSFHEKIVAKVDHLINAINRKPNEQNEKREAQEFPLLVQSAIWEISWGYIELLSDSTLKETIMFHVRTNAQRFAQKFHTYVESFRGDEKKKIEKAISDIFDELHVFGTIFALIEEIKNGS